MISDLCDRGECETCFEDELDGCRHECHPVPTDCLAGVSRPTTEQPSAGGARQAYDPAGGLPRTVRAASAAARSGPAVSGAPHGTAGGKTSTPARPAQDPRAGVDPQDREAGPVPAGRSSLPGSACLEPAEPGTKAPPPEPGECSRLGGTTPVPGAASGPARGALDGARGVPAGSTGRTFTIALPAGLELLNANDRDGHWARRKRITRALRETAGWKARIQHIPPLQRAYVLGVYEPPDRRRRDPANLYPSFKACVDGLVDAGVLPDDDAAHVDGPDMRLGNVCPLGRLVLHLTEVAATGGDAA